MGKSIVKFVIPDYIVNEINDVAKEKRTNINEISIKIFDNFIRKRNELRRQYLNSIDEL